MGTDKWKLYSVLEVEKFHSRGHKPSNQARFFIKEHEASPNTKQLVKYMLVHLGRDERSGKGVRNRPPTPGPK